MHISCSICSDLFVPTSDVFVTQCGHLFHYVCLIQWIERSQSCPECRSKTTDKSVHRLYFNVATCEPEEDASLLRNKIDSLTFQIRLKDQDIKNVSEENKKLNTQNSGLRDEIKSQEKDIRTLKSTLSAQREQIKHLQTQTKAIEDAQDEARRLRKEFNDLKSVQIIVQGTVADVENMLEKYGDSYDSVKSLATYVSVLKREMQVSSEKKRDMRERLRTCQRDLSIANLERDKLTEELNVKTKQNKQYEDDMKHMEQEMRGLQKKVRDLEKAISSPSGKNPRDSALRRLILESPLPEAAKRPKLTDPNAADTPTKVMDDQIYDLMSPDSKASEHTTEPRKNTYPSKEHPRILSTRPQASNLRHPSDKNYSIFKRPGLTVSRFSGSANPEAAYDGLGGHSKADEFPVPSLKFKSVPLKKTKSSTLLWKTKRVTNATVKLDKFIDIM
ncbi:E3 ubiquitin-protein ligase TRAIP-like [Periplaneta americana]|uniref:E3 ubiquitin-protein ligase TRAIP-like n=1 Tax=Periplaneta americana TaxID=6978 RepID=UPI0037E8CF19